MLIGRELYDNSQQPAELRNQRNNGASCPVDELKGPNNLLVNRLQRLGNRTDRIQHRTNRAVNDVHNVLDAAKQSELGIDRRRKDHAGREGGD